MTTSADGGGWQEALALLARAQARTEEQVAALAAFQTRTEERLDALTARVDALAAAQARTDEQLRILTARVDALTERVDTLTLRLEELATQMGQLVLQVKALGSNIGKLLGWRWESLYRNRAPSYLGRLARRLEVLSGQQVAHLLEDAVDEGKLSEAEADDIRLADVICLGRSREARTPIYLLLEVSAGVGLSDVVRASRRARLLSQTGTPVMPVVAGERIIPEAQQEAVARGVWQLNDGRVTSPTDDSAASQE